MACPPLVLYPPARLRAQLPPELWASCINAWVFLAHEWLSKDRSEFISASTADESLPDYLLSYVREHLYIDRVRDRCDEERELRKVTFLLVHRLFLESPKPGPPLLNWAFLGDFCTVFAKNSNLKDLLRQTWELQDLDSNYQMLQGKRIFQKLIDDHRLEDPALEICLKRTVALLKACHRFGNFLMVGSDTLDSITKAWSGGSQDLRTKLVVIAYLGLSSLLEGQTPNYSLLLDHLYSLKASAERQSPSPSSSLLARLVSTTSILRKLQRCTTGSNAARAKPLLIFLESLGTRPKIRLTFNKGKGKVRDENGQHEFGDMHVHKMSLVTQVQDLFPELGAGFIAKLLSEYHDDPEQVTAHLLDGSLPPHLQEVDHTEALDHTSLPAPTAAPISLPIRKNVFDEDAFDKLAVPAANIHFGRRETELKTDTELNNGVTTRGKAAILAALAAFDSDDDERDDTYDVEDVGGTVDTAIPGSDDMDLDLRDKNEEALFSAYKMSPDVYQRDANTRRGKARAVLKSETGLTDEAIEGWGIILARDPKRLRRLEAKFSLTTVGQRQLASTAYRATDASQSGTEGEEGDGTSGSRGGFRGRISHRGRGRGRAGNVAGAADDKSTQIARHRKDANKGSRANHNRRDQRARKVARTGFVG